MQKQKQKLITALEKAIRDTWDYEQDAPSHEQEVLTYADGLQHALAIIKTIK